VDPFAFADGSMLGILLAGIALGLMEGFLPGPLMMVVISETMKHDWKSGAKVSASVLITDGPIILLMALAWNSLNAYENWLSAAAAILLLWLSWKAFNTKVPTISETQEVEHSLRNGILTNLVNPNPYRFWGLVGAPFLVAAWGLNPWAPALFIIGFFSVFIVAKVFIAVTVHRSRGFLQSRGYLIVMRSCGIGLLLFAIGFGLRLT